MLRRFFPPDPSDAAPKVVLQPRVAPAGELRVWIGAFGRQAVDRQAAAGSLRWKLDGRVVAPRALHPANGDGLVVAHRHGATAATGVFALGAADGVKPGFLHRLELTAGGLPPATLRLQTIPEAIPGAMEGELRIMLVSCFHQAEDKNGAAGAAVANLPEAARPHLTLLMGDQVYLDLPTLANFPDDEAKLARRFERDYRLNWAMPAGYSQVMGAAPSVSQPDDHEYWNNFPHRSPAIQNSWSKGGQRRWTAAADQLYGAFQLSHPAKLGEPIEIDIPPLSVMVLDQRSKRQSNVNASLAPGALNKVSKWVDRLLHEKGFGALVTGQSLLDAPTSKFEGKVKDRTLADYGDYAELMAELDRLADAGRPVLLLTGDVHWGRVTIIRRRGRVRFYEVICSPSSLVTTVGVDQLKTLGAGFRSLFGGDPNPWPRHGDPDLSISERVQEVLGPGHRAEVFGSHKGNQIALLTFRRRGGGLELDVTYHSTGAVEPPKRLGPLQFPPR